MTSKSPSIEFDMAPFSQQIVETNAHVAKVLLHSSELNAGIVLVQALLLRELGRSGLIDTTALRAEAIARAADIGPPVAEVVRSIFVVEPRQEPDMDIKSQLTLIAGGRPGT